MIFIAVGTHYLPFDRLIKIIKDLIKERIIQEKVCIQSGTANVKILGVKQKDYYSFEEFIENIKEARIVICHAGPAIIYQSMVYGKKKPIVISRLKKFKEHVSDHQLYFVEDLEKENKIYLANNKKELKKLIENYDEKKARVKKVNSNSKNLLAKKLQKYLSKLE